MGFPAPTAIAACALALVACSSPDSDPTLTHDANPLIEMSWGDIANIDGATGFGMKVVLQPTGELSCQYSFSGDNWGFTGKTSTSGTLTPSRMRWLDRTFSDPQFLALPDKMPSGTTEPRSGDYSLVTSFGDSRKQIHLVPGAIVSEEDNNRLMMAVDAVFETCPTRPITPITD